MGLDEIAEVVVGIVIALGALLFLMDWVERTTSAPPPRPRADETPRASGTGSAFRQR
ncbi:MAG: hypothetical protein J0I40_00440 [Cellulomonas sp.]|uniref:hypothetical protein n=1 Tax=Cellulomonas sp. 73-92 TaxID=1895740 RepID=UPI000A5179CE|nr:hypothetical protein [Cellulomonas sp. 73-92]MBN9373867.1 hypothetical protein [Cellulomonas sp.]